MGQLLSIRLAGFAALAAILAIWSPRAFAQPCCTGATTISPARLSPPEEGLVGLSARMTYKLGDFDTQSSYVGMRSGRSEIGLEQDLLAGIRVTHALQLGLVAALIETWRQDPGVSELGGGIGDIGVSARYDLFDMLDSDVIPGLGILAGVSIPTGTAPEKTTKPLATDATGTGHAQATLALSLEHLFFTRLFASLNAGVTKWFARTVADMEISRGLELFVSAGASFVPVADLNLGAVITFRAQGENAVDGVDSPGTSHRATSLSIVSALPLGDLRIQGSLFGVLPINELGRNQSVDMGLQLAGIWAWR